MIDLSDDKAADQAGRELVSLLGLSPHHDWRTGSLRFATTAGTKTYAGLARTVIRVFQDSPEEKIK
jgi:hypothetical protein